MKFYVLLSIVLVVSAVEADINLNPLSDEFIDHINSNQSLWTAGRNFHPDRPLIYFKRLMGSLRDINLHYLPRKRYIGKGKPPPYFDARQQWPNCPSIKQIRDQGSCGSCWAVAATTAMTDRVCINSNGKTNFYFSEDDLLSCCSKCGSGCDGGLLSKAWQYTNKQGVVSGGTYHSRQGCKPYEIAPCEHDHPGDRPDQRPRCGKAITPRCRPVCQSRYKKKYTDDKKKIGRPYVLSKAESIQWEIIMYGPVTTSMLAYADFLSYKTGVYKHINGKYLGEHSVKLLGWGEEGGVKYWLAANSWNTDWGNLNGFFKILRGVNECNVEKYAVAAHVNL